MSENLTPFEKILNGTIPCKKVYEDDWSLAFYDLEPKAPYHILIIPKEKIISIKDAEDKHMESLGRLLLTAKKVAEILNIPGYRLVFNVGPEGGQTVHYLHCHLLGGRALSWPPG